MVIAGAAEPANETRIEGADILEHPVAALAVQYVELVHAGKIEDAMRLASTAYVRDSIRAREWRVEAGARSGHRCASGILYLAQSSAVPPERCWQCMSASRRS